MRAQWWRASIMFASCSECVARRPKMNKEDTTQSRHGDQPIPKMKVQHISGGWHLGRDLNVHGRQDWQAQWPDHNEPGSCPSHREWVSRDVGPRMPMQRCSQRTCQRLTLIRGPFIGPLRPQWETTRGRGQHLPGRGCGRSVIAMPRVALATLDTDVLTLAGLPKATAQWTIVERTTLGPWILERIDSWPFSRRHSSIPSGRGFGCFLLVVVGGGLPSGFHLGLLTFTSGLVLPGLGWRLCRCGWRARALSSGLGCGRSCLLTSLLELIQLCTRSCIIPELLVVVEHLQESRRECRIVGLLIRVEAINFSPDQRIGRQQQSQSSVLMPPLLELGQIFQRTRCHGELADVQVLERHKESMELVHDLRLWRWSSWLINLHHFQEVFRVLREARLLNDRLTASTHLSHFIEVDSPVNQEISLEPFHKLPMGLTVMRQQHIRVSLNKLAAKLGVILSWNFRHFGWIFFHLGSASCKMILHCWASLPYSGQRS